MRTWLLALSCLLLSANAESPPRADDRSSPPAGQGKQDNQSTQSTEILQLLDDTPTELGTPDPSRAGEDIAGRAGSPLLEVAQQMNQAQQLLNRQQTAQPTQRLQQDILRQLDALIATAEQQAQKSGEPRAGQDHGSTNRETSGAGTSPTGTTGGSSTATATQSQPDDEWITRIWGHLPDQMRQRIRSPLHEEFLPSYEQLIQEYYRRLAEGNK